MKKLGKIELTNKPGSKNFEIINFKDFYGDKCSLEMSTLAEYQQPGISAVWLGREESNTHSVTGEPLMPRMHLHRKQVESLILTLQSWLEQDTFNTSQHAENLKRNQSN